MQVSLRSWIPLLDRTAATVSRLRVVQTKEEWDVENRVIVIRAGSRALRALANIARPNDRTGMPSLMRLMFDMRETGGAANLMFPATWRLLMWAA